MANHRFEIVYADSTRRQIGTSERDFLLSSKQIKQVGPTRYKFTGPVKTFSNFRALGEWFTVHQLNPEQIRRFLKNLAVLYELREKRDLQLEETPEAFGLRLEQMGVMAAEMGAH